MKTLLNIAFSIFIVALVACVDKFDPKLTGKMPYLVFEGILTDEAGPHYFSLSNSAGYNSKESVYDKYVNAAKIWITDSQNTRTDLIDLGKGKFSTPEGFRGQIGNAYTLHVRNEGIDYESSAETMRYTPPIDKVYSEYKQITTLKSTIRGVFNIFLDTHDPAQEGDFYRWTWKNYTKAKICELYTPPFSIAVFLRPCCEDCWNINQCIGCITMASDKLINGKNLIKQGIAQIPYDETIPYYMQIKQLSLSREAYNYWLSVDAQANNSGGIFDVAPGKIRGNIKNLSDETLPMLGFFQVSAVSQKIVYIQRNSVGYPPFEKRYITDAIWPECTTCKEGPYRTAIKPLNWVD